MVTYLWLQNGFRKCLILSKIDLYINLDRITKQLYGLRKIKTQLSRHNQTQLIFSEHLVVYEGN